MASEGERRLRSSTPVAPAPHAPHRRLRSTRTETHPTRLFLVRWLQSCDKVIHAECFVVVRWFRSTRQVGLAAQRGAHVVAQRRARRRPARRRGARRHRQLYGPAGACGDDRRRAPGRRDRGRRPGGDPARARSRRGRGVLRCARRRRDRRRGERDAPPAPDRARARPRAGPLSDHDRRPARAVNPAGSRPTLWSST